MTREQAIESLSWLKTRLSVGLGGMDKLSPHYKDMADEVQSIALAIAALRQGWVRTADRVPTKADSNSDWDVIAVYDCPEENEQYVGTKYWKRVAESPEDYPYWMPLPKLPEVEG